MQRVDTINMKAIPVVIVVAGEKLGFVRKVLLNLNHHCGFKIFYVICPRNDVEATESRLHDLDFTTIVLNEDLIVNGMTLDIISKYLAIQFSGLPNRYLAGWYFQQFLKIGFSRFANEYKHYLIWDADTFLTKNIEFFEKNVILLTRGNEFHPDYFATIRQLLPDINPQRYSHISQHIMVNVTDMRELILKIGGTNTEWWLDIINALTGSTPQRFSEYETYSSFCLSHWPDRYRSIRRSWFRFGMSYFRAGPCRSDVSKLAVIYDFVAFESWDVGLLRYVRAHIMVNFKRVQSYFRSVFLSY